MLLGTLALVSPAGAAPINPCKLLSNSEASALLGSSALTFGHGGATAGAKTVTIGNATGLGSTPPETCSFVSSDQVAPSSDALPSIFIVLEHGERMREGFSRLLDSFTTLVQVALPPITGGPPKGYKMYVTHFANTLGYYVVGPLRLVSGSRTSSTPSASLGALKDGYVVQMSVYGIPDVVAVGKHAMADALGRL